MAAGAAGFENILSNILLIYSRNYYQIERFPLPHDFFIPQQPEDYTYVLEFNKVVIFPKNFNSVPANGRIFKFIVFWEISLFDALSNAFSDHANKDYFPVLLHSQRDFMLDPVVGHLSLILVAEVERNYYRLDLLNHINQFAANKLIEDREAHILDFFVYVLISWNCLHQHGLDGGRLEIEDIAKPLPVDVLLANITWDKSFFVEHPSAKFNAVRNTAILLLSLLLNDPFEPTWYHTDHDLFLFIQSRYQTNLLSLQAARCLETMLRIANGTFPVQDATSPLDEVIANHWIQQEE